MLLQTDLLALRALALALVGTLVVGYASVVYLVYRDGRRRRREDARRWAYAVAAFPPAVLAYLLRRRRFGPPVEAETPRDRLARAAVAAVLSAWILGTLASPPDAFLQLYYVAGALIVTAPTAYVLLARA
ncbi:MAG: hypothetical protein ABEJ40_10890 [Haloarculaceae archaeon]